MKFLQMIINHLRSLQMSFNDKGSSVGLSGPLWHEEVSTWRGKPCYFFGNFHPRSFAKKWIFNKNNRVEEVDRDPSSHQLGGPAMNQFVVCLWNFILCIFLGIRKPEMASWLAITSQDVLSVFQANRLINLIANISPWTWEKQPISYKTTVLFWKHPAEADPMPLALRWVAQKTGPGDQG